MSAVKIVVQHLVSGFSAVSIDGKHCGRLENLGDDSSVAEVLRNLIKFGNLENIEVEERKEKTK